MASLTTSARVFPERSQSAAADRPRPISFLVSTTTGPQGIRQRIGLPAYSYYYVVEALAPVLEAFGTWRLIEHPESQLAFAARRAEAEGFRPVHLAVHPLHDVYLSPALPNILFPFWEFPDVPSRDFGDDTRQNWARVARSASLILTACRFTAESFRRTGTAAPVAVVPIPLAPDAGLLPPWDREAAWTLRCRHEILGPAVRETNPTPMIEASVPLPASGPLPWRVARGAFRRVAPWLSPRTVSRLTRIKRGVVGMVRRRPDELIYVGLRDGYRRHLQRWLSPEALQKITNIKGRLLRLVGREPVIVPDPPLPSGDLTLGDGLIYLTIFNIGDARKNYLDLLTAFLDAFRDRPDVTLVIKLVTNVVRENHEAGLLRERYRALGIEHRCRVVVITDYLSDEQMTGLFRASTFYVNASFAEGACLPLMRALAGGRPAIAPDHTAMADYMSEEVGFVPRSFPEPIHWPHDPEERLETYRYRPVWSDLRDAFLASAEVADHDRPRYDTMAAAARARMSRYASRAATAAALREALECLDSETSRRASE